MTHTPASSSSDPPRPLVLVIDDDPQVRAFARVVLVSHGYEVEEANDGRPALRAVRKRVPDLVLCDMFMPDQEGLQTIAELRALAPDLPIVAMSGGGAVCRWDPLPYTTSLGAARTLRKPFSDADLIAVVTAVLGPPAARTAPPGP